MSTIVKHTEPLVFAEHAYRRYCLNIEPNITLADLLKPEMWSRNTDGQLRPGDMVCVRSQTEGFDCVLIVKAILPGAGVIMRLDDSQIPGGATYERMKTIETAVRAEEKLAKQAEIDAAIGGRP